jgi:membrane protein YqaA with SNARE-associated domain
VPDDCAEALTTMPYGPGALVVKPQQALRHASCLQWLYHRLITLAEGPHALWVMMAVSFAESSIFPLPPDPVLVPMMIARPQRAYRYALLCTLASVLGGLVGCALGALLFETVGRPLIDLYGLGPSFQVFRARFAVWGSWIIIAKGFTPIPFKLVTIASGAFGLDISRFLLACIVARAGRYLLLAVLLQRYGSAVRAVLDRYLTLVAVGGMLLLVAGVMALWLIG